MAHDEGLGADIEQGPVRTALLVGEDPQLGDLARQPVGDRLVVVRADAQEHDQPGSDRADDLAVDPDLGPRHPLEDRAHAGPAR